MKVLNYLLCIASITAGVNIYGKNNLKILPETKISNLQPASQKKVPARMKIGDSIDFNLNIQKNDMGFRRYLRITGNVDGTGKGEGAFRGRDFFLSETAVSDADNGTPYYLKVKGWGKKFSQCVFCLLPMNKVKRGSNVNIKIKVSGEELKFGDEGKLGLKVEFYLKNNLYKPGDISRTPERSIFIPFPQGSYKWKDITENFKIPEDTDSILLTVEGFNFSGSFSMKLPDFTQDGKKITLPEFKPDSKKWIGKNISRLAWPEFAFAIDGKNFFQGPVFQRAANRDANFELDLPNNISPGTHKLTIKLASTYGKNKDYTLTDVKMLEERSDDFNLVAPDFVPEHSEFAVMVETNRDNMTLQLSANEGSEPIAATVTLRSKGIHAIPFRSGNAGTTPVLTIGTKSNSKTLQIRMVTSGKSDKILLSTSDWIYTARKEFPKYFKWICSNKICNALVIRPSYQWNGTRTRDKKFFNNLRNLCENFYMPYSLMVEGRCLPGAEINPEDEWLESKYYLGRQSHEDDGSYYYWGPWGPYPNDMVRQLMERFLDGGGIFPKFRYKYDAVSNMKEGAEYFIHNLKKAKHASTRHTGPSVLFRYFYQAGYAWLGAEQGYGPEEVIVSALRGASKAYGKTRMGSHHATQWGGGYNVEQQFRSHAVVYMNGVTHINTEDAVWDTESLNYRFSQEGLKHTARQKDIMDFILTHRRRGNQVSKIAVLQGKYDGWVAFGGSPIWGQKGDEWKPGDAEAGFDLLKVFYPRKKLQGYSVGGTPFGMIDLLPVEAPQDVLDQYDTLIFLGWNTYDETYFTRLKRFVQDGGTLLMTLAHLNTNLHHNSKITLPEKSVFYETIKQGVDKNNISEIQEIAIGKGRVLLFNTVKYPGSKELHDKYAEEMKKLGKNLIKSERKKGWIRGSKLVEFTVWDDKRNHQKYRTIYLLNAQSDKANPAKLLLSNAELPIKVEPGIIKTFVISEGLAVTSSDSLTDIIKIIKDGNEVSLTAQIINPCTVTVFDSRSSRTTEIVFDKTGVITKKISLN